MTTLQALAERIIDVARVPLPDDVAHEARRCFMNVLGTAIGASRTSEIEGLIAAGVQLGTPEVVVLGRSEQLDRYFAACAIGFAGHFDDFDDTHLETVIHPGAATIGALLPIGQMVPVAASTALNAMALGVEVQLRIGLAMSPSHYDLGWHITGTCGVFGSAVAAGIALGLDADALGHALGIASTMFVGQREAFGTPVKPYHAGKAASNGLLAASLALAGVTAPMETLTGEHGYFAMLSDAWSPAWIDPEDLGRRWAILDNTYKPYPCGIVAHPAIEAATEVHRELGEVEIEDVVDVAVACNPLVAELMGRATASTGLEARFCAIHGVAVGLLTGRGGLAEFSDDMARDATVSQLRDRTRLIPDDVHARDAATVTVRLRDGSTVTRRVMEASGSKERPLSDGQLREKFVALVEPLMHERANELALVAMRLGDGVTLMDVDQMVRGR